MLYETQDKARTNRKKSQLGEQRRNASDCQDVIVIEIKHVPHTGTERFCLPNFSSSAARAAQQIE
jgi:hypothetical protein